jgi:hypothetical protein
VLECNHTLILGWSDKIYSLLTQLCLGYELAGGTTVRAASMLFNCLDVDGGSDRLSQN